MLIVIVLILLLWIVLGILLTAWSMWFQGFLYTEPSTGLVWRAPAAASAIMFVVIIWVIADYRSQGLARPIWETASTSTKHFKELRIPVGSDKEEVYHLVAGNKYRDATGKEIPGRLPKIIVVEDGQRSVFEPELDAQGKFKRRKTGTLEEPLRYIDEKGRVMKEGSPGQVESFRIGVFLGNVFLNVLFFAACFLSIWLLIRFQWAHALGHAVVLALLLLLFVLPPILSQVENVARARAAQTS